MRGALVLGLALILALPLGACKAPTKHTGKRPEAVRRESDLSPDKTLEERLLERQARLEEMERQGQSYSAEDQFVGVGSTNRFHHPECDDLADVPRADRVLFVSRFDALDGGYHPCTTCRPNP
jgi:hypothetical protein